MVRIAVVNDDLAFVELVSEALELEGWETLRYLRGEGTFEDLRELQPDLVMVDIRMEGADAGWRLLELLRMDPRTAGIEAVVCSADETQVQARTAWLEAEGIGILPKPFELDDLYRLIKERLRAPNGGRSGHLAAP